jgi:hypothetical protein
VVFKRTPQSGGWSHAPEFKVAGDLACNDARFPFCVEVKRRESWSWREFMAGRRSPVWTWWRQACAAAEASGLEPMMWMRRNHGDWIVVLTAALPLKCLKLEALRFWLPQGPAVPLPQPACVYAPKLLLTQPGQWV